MYSSLTFILDEKNSLQLVGWFHQQFSEKKRSYNDIQLNSLIHSAILNSIFNKKIFKYKYFFQTSIHFKRSMLHKKTLCMQLLYYIMHFTKKAFSC